MNATQEIQNYINKIIAQYNAEEQLIQEMKADASQIARNESEMNRDLQKTHLVMHWTYNNPNNLFFGTLHFDHTMTPTAQNDYNNRNAQNGSMENRIHSDEAQLESLDSSFSSFSNTLNGLLSEIENLKSNKDVSADDLGSDLASIKNVMNDLFTTMHDHLEMDKASAILNGNESEKLSDAQIQALTEQMIHYASAESHDFSVLTNQLASSLESYHEQMEKARINKPTFIQEWNSFWGTNILKKGSGGLELNGKTFGTKLDVTFAKDQQIQANANAMMKQLQSTLNATSVMVSSAGSATMQQLQTMFKALMKKIEEVLQDKDLSAAAKTGKILNLMMLCLGLYDMMKQDVESKKSELEQKMIAANAKSAKMNLDELTTDQKLLIDALEQSKLLQQLLQKSQIALDVIFTLMAPGVGSMIAMGVITILQATGTLDKWSTDLTSALTKDGCKNAKIWSDVIMGASEAGGTMAGGFVLDQVIGLAAQSAVKQATEAAIATTEDSVAAAAERAGQAALPANAVAELQQESIDAASDVIQQAAKAAAEKAAKVTAEAFISMNPFAFLRGNGVFQETVDAAAKDAAETAITESSDIARSAAQGNVISQEEINGVAKRATAQALVRALHVEGSASWKIGKWTVKGEKTALEKTANMTSASAGSVALSRGAAALVYGLASNDLLVDVLKEIQKKESKEEADNQSWLMTSAGIMQTLLQGVAFGVGSGAIANIETDGAKVMQKVAQGMMALPTATNGLASLGLYEIDMAKADTQKALMVANGISELLRTNGEQVQKDFSQELQQFIQSEQMEKQSQQRLAAHLQDGVEAGIQVLQAQMA